MDAREVYLSSSNSVSEVLLVPARSHQGILDMMAGTSLWGKCWKDPKTNVCSSQKPKFWICLLGCSGLGEILRNSPLTQDLGLSGADTHGPSFLRSSEEIERSVSQRLFPGGPHKAMGICRPIVTQRAQEIKSEEAEREE